MKDAPNSDKKMLCTDLDGTFIGDDESMYELLRMIDCKDFLLVFSTGRHLRSIMQFVREKGIRIADACICMVGTVVYFAQEGELILDNNWSRIISQDWDREKMVQLMSDIKELVWQDEEWQTEFKSSYFLRENQTEVINEIKQRIQKAKLKAKVIYSASQFLDFLPLKSGKSEAVKYVADNFGVSTDNVIVCGDSGNDLDMFMAGFKGVIVGNAHAELENFKGENAYHANGKYSTGIIEGLRHFNYI